VCDLNASSTKHSDADDHHSNRLAFSCDCQLTHWIVLFEW